jgi:transcriptional regulator with XRE-family HTH domain
MMPQSLGERLAQARREKGVRDKRDILRTEIAEAAGVDPSMVTAYEKGASVPREEVLAKLAEFLHVTPAYLRYGVTESGRALDRTAEEAEGQTPELLHEKAPARKASAKKTGRKVG